MAIRTDNITVTDKVFGPSFTRELLRWNEVENNRQMPWKGEKDPYRIWLSEIILQQTRVDQGLRYYERFIQALPTVHHLAKAPEQEVFKLWEGLGYYSRCRNLIATAKFIVEECAGQFPENYEGLLALKGVGPYTAAAIASFAYNAHHAVLDGNVFRVLARIYNDHTPIDSTEGKTLFAAKALELLPSGSAGLYNQALMDFGATICKPVPECARCFFNNKCRAFLQNCQAALPVKEKKTAVRERWFHYVILESGGAIAIKQRTAKDIWQNLFEVLLVEGETKLEKAELFSILGASYGLEGRDLAVISSSGNTTQRLTHQFIYFSFLHLELPEKTPVPGYQWVAKADLATFAFPKTLQQFLSRNMG
ncbi:MAG TPA: A/G-specific adenine glycosylase [Flavisolibacter sp.]|jgi:A/G-specific adenine glycosylase|nr:A/G-specific adenine glycosylase [Flavisolibacter sp.]